MRLLNVTDATASYPSYLASLSARAPGFDSLSYEEQHSVINRDHFVWGMPYHQSMEAFGYEVLNVDRGIDSIQNAWAAENGYDARKLSRDSIVVEQARAFQPDIVLYDPSNPALLQRIRDASPSVRLVLGWVGSALTTGRTWGMIDIMLTCAPESVGRLSAMGLKARHVNHSFNPALSAILGPRTERLPITFIGSIVRRSEFHLTREQILVGLCEAVPLSIYSPSSSVRVADYIKIAAAGAASAGLDCLRRTGVLNRLKKTTALRRIERVASPMRRPVHPKLASRLRPGVYGLEFFKTLQNSDISLNIHADTSPTHASNIRLYEATGVGSCLLTDWKSNLADLYSPDSEVAVYRSADEAIEKARWLMDNAGDREAMAAAAMRRTLAAHTFAHRAAQIDEIIRESMRRA